MPFPGNFVGTEKVSILCFQLSLRPTGNHWHKIKPDQLAVFSELLADQQRLTREKCHLISIIPNRNILSAKVNSFDLGDDPLK